MAVSGQVSSARTRTRQLGVRTQYRSVSLGRLVAVTPHEPTVMGDSEDPAAKRLKQSQEQCAPGSCDEAAEGPGMSMPCRDDVAHFEGLDPTFASTVNLVLSVRDKDLTVKFPVHKDVISGHSPILCQFIKELPAANNTTPHLPMVGDSYSAVHDILACIYGPFHPSRNPAYTKPDSISLADWPIQVNNLYLAHKYGMLSILMAQEESLMLALIGLVDGLYTVERGSVVMDIAIVAKACRCKRMLASCETFVVKHFESFADFQRQEVLSKLSPASLFRVSQGLIHHLRTTVSFADTALFATATEATTCSSKFAIGDACPRCSQPLERPHSITQRNVVHRDRQSSCKWPQEQYWARPDMDTDEAMAQYLACLAKAED